LHLDLNKLRNHVDAALNVYASIAYISY